jgi:hypothetical protein
LFRGNGESIKKNNAPLLVLIKGNAPDEPFQASSFQEILKADND